MEWIPYLDIQLINRIQQGPVSLRTSLLRPTFAKQGAYKGVHILFRSKQP